MTCPRTDELLARHLDGEAGDPPILDEHLSGCAVCRRQLRRARRLDAVLAEASGRQAERFDPGPEEIERWLRQVLPRPAAPSGAGHPARRGLVLFAAGFLLALWLMQSPGRSRPAEPPYEPRTAAAEPAEPGPAPIALGALPARRRIPVAPGFRIAVAGFRPPLPGFVAPQLALPVLRAAAALELLADRQAGSVVRWLAEEDDPLALRAFLDRGRDDRTLRAHLRSRLRAREPAIPVVVAALRLRTPVLDREVQRWLRRHPESAALVARLLAETPEPEGRVARLLAAWSDLVARAAQRDDVAGAALWFGDQPPGTARALVAALSATGNAEKRRRILLALGICAKADTIPALLQRLTGTSFEEAHLAAWALSRMPRASLQPLVARACKPGAALLKAALAGAGIPAAGGWIRQLELTPEEDALLRGGAFTPEQLPIAASLFAQRRASGS